MNYYIQYFYYIFKYIFLSIFTIYPLILIVYFEVRDDLIEKYKYFSHVTLLVWLILFLPILWILCKLEKPIKPIKTDEEFNEIL